MKMAEAPVCKLNTVCVEADMKGISRESLVRENRSWYSFLLCQVYRNKLLWRLMEILLHFPKLSGKKGDI